MSRSHSCTLAALTFVGLAGVVGCVPGWWLPTGDPNAANGPPTTTARVAPAGNGVAMIDLFGKWFFILRTSDGQPVFTQRGDFTLSADGKIVYAENWYVQGFKGDDLGQLRTDKLRDLKVVIGQASPVWSTKTVQLEGNVNPEDLAVGDKVSTTFQIYDSNGDPHDVCVVLTVAGKDDTETQLQLDVYEGVEGGTLMGHSIFRFDGEGDIIGTSVLSVGMEGTPPIVFDLDLSRVMASSRRDTGIQMASQNGMGKGTLESYKIGNDGRILGHYSNGLEPVLGQFVVASFDNSDGLAPVQGRNDLFLATDASGPPRPAVSNAQ
jgi:flagellar hook protein FlgE